jgi:YCII-related domain
VKGVTDEYMREMLGITRRYTLVILRRTAKRDEPRADQIVWEHGRRNFQLRREGLLCIVGPAVRDESDVAGIYIFSTDMERTRRIMNEDPAVKAGIFVYDAHVIEGFPGDALAK